MLCYPTAQSPKHSLSIVGAVGGNATVTAATLHGQLWFINASLSLIDSHVGDVDVDDLQTLVNMMCEYGVLPLLNNYAQHGFPLPIIDGAPGTWFAAAVCLTVCVSVCRCYIDQPAGWVR